jgi:hypothetical protein
MEESVLDKLVQKDYVTNIRRFAIGALLAASIGWGWVAFVATGLTATAISGVEFHYDRKRKQKELLSLYKDDIAILQHKKPEDVTIEDLKQVAAAPEKGGKGIKALSDGLVHYDWDLKFRWGVNIISSLIVTTALVTAAMAFPAMLANITTILGLGLVGLGYMAINRTVRYGAEMVFGHQDRAENFNQQLMDMSKHIKKEPVSALRVFSLFASADPELQADIKRKFGHGFDDLTVMQKQQAVMMYEPERRVAALTHEINHGNMKPGVVGFLAYGQGCDVLPDCRKYQQLFSAPLYQAKDLATEETQRMQYSQRILAERQEGTTEKTLH